ncbi:hypothetical protein [Oceaniradius stylonematis]|jgi:hypothetical protein|uniref:hypothetical protein n=1 Tax=Oceaniradius stylonematis TaxID=2184161 RepID=UPI00273F047A|nr:hypothetical protein [Oceaniradius stylonematis]
MARHWTVAATLLASAGAAGANQIGTPDHVEQASFRGCGWYVVLGCGRDRSALVDRMNYWGGPMAGGGAGLDVIDTGDYPNFRNGFFCLVDGPYGHREAAQSVAWTEAVPDAYVKSGC